MAKSLVSKFSNELILNPFKQGVQLCHPKDNLKDNENINELLFTLDDVMEWGTNVYFMDVESNVQNINEISAIRCGWDSAKDAIGKNISSVWDTKDAELSLWHNQEVLRKEKMIARNISGATVKERKKEDYLCFRYPWYDMDGKILGIFGISMLLKYNLAGSQLTLAEIITRMLKGRLLNDEFVNGSRKYIASNDVGLNNITAQKHSNTNLESIIDPFSAFQKLLTMEGDQVTYPKLSKRQKECLLYVVQGKTAKEIGQILNLHYKTVEHYLATIKTKWDCSSKSALIEKALFYLKQFSHSMND